MGSTPIPGSREVCMFPVQTCVLSGSFLPQSKNLTILLTGMYVYDCLSIVLPYDEMMT